MLVIIAARWSLPGGGFVGGACGERLESMPASKLQATEVAQEFLAILRNSQESLGIITNYKELLTITRNHSEVQEMTRNH